MNSVSDYYHTDKERDIEVYHIAELPNREAAETVASHCTSEARTLRLKAFGQLLYTAGAALALTAVAAVIGQIAGYVIGTVALPLIILSPVHKLVMLVGNIGAMAIFAKWKGVPALKSMWNVAMQHFENANHYYKQALDAKLKMSEFARA